MATASDWKGPNSETNWLIPGKLLMGACPRSLAEAEAVRQAHIKTFVCLLDEEDFENRMPRPEYFSAARELGLHVVWHPIPDGKTVADELAFKLAHELVKYLRKGGIVFLNCWNGYGRAATIGVMVVGLWYGMSMDEALAFLRRSHASRSNQAVSVPPCPLTSEQDEQIERFFKVLAHEIPSE